MQMIELLKFIKINGGVTIYDIMERFALGRTAALYQIEKIADKGLIVTYKNRKKTVYMLLNSHALKNYFKDRISELTQDMQELIAKDKKIRFKSRNKKLTVAFVNYYDILPLYRKELEAKFEIVDFTDGKLYITPEEFVKRAKDADIVVNNYATDYFSSEMLERLPRMQYMHLSTHMYRYIDIGALRRNNVHLSNMPYTYKSIAVAEYLLAQTFALLRETVTASEQLKAGVNEFRYFRGEQLRGKKVIIFGTDIGTKDVVENLKGLGVEVAIFTDDKNVDPAFFGVGHFATEEEVFETGDILYVSWTGDEKKGLVGNIDENFLNRIKRPVYIISIYKHRKIDYKKLRELIYSGMIKGIAFDSYPEISGSQRSEAKSLLFLPNVIVTPDIGWYTSDSIENMNKFTNERLLAYANGQDDYLLL